MDRDPADLCSTSARELARLLRARRVSAREVVGAHLARIAAVNPSLNAIVTLCADTALARAADLDQQIVRAGPVGALHGLPIAHKDLVDTAGVRTTYGSLLFANHVPTRDHLLVERTRAAGAVMMGKTNTPEFGMGSQTHNRIFGATRNPHDPSRTSGGSTGGGASALASGMIAIADGSDLGGSLRNPASFCNVVGLRPSPGRVPDVPSSSAWFDLAVLGPMARTVDDSALLLSTLAGPDLRAPGCLPEEGRHFDRDLGRDFRGVRVAFGRDLGGLPFEPEVLAGVRAQLPVFERLGCQVEEAEPDLQDADRIFEILRGWQVAADLGGIVAEDDQRVAPMVRENLAYGRTVTAQDLAWAQQRRSVLVERAGAFFAAHEFWVVPVSQVLPFDLTVPWVRSIAGEPMSNYLTWMRSCSRISTLAAPAISVPATVSSNGLPIGIQIVGRPRDDLGVLQLARAFEEAVADARPRPRGEGVMPPSTP
ncbi:MAG TPA: amidase [Verrucomicrobiae bacterium]|nr:amidase [Verrucomicrobiae bacterium]